MNGYKAIAAYPWCNRKDKIMLRERFNDLVKMLLSDTFEKLGYKFSDDCFFLNRSSGFRNVVSFDFDGNRSFRVFVGIDYPYDQVFDVSAPPEGARLCCYFTGGSLSEIPKDIFFKDEPQLVNHLDRFKVYFLDVIKPDFFDVVNTPENYADSLPATECIARFEIYRNEGLQKKAADEAKLVIDSYKGMLDIPEIRKFINDELKPFVS